eukprot:scaffold65197_cov26-Prasinocladus_malaysianus.AAC.1
METQRKASNAKERKWDAMNWNEMKAEFSSDETQQIDTGMNETRWNQTDPFQAGHIPGSLCEIDCTLIMYVEDSADDYAA